MSMAATTNSDQFVEYLQIYREMRNAHGINNPCIAELKAAIAFECVSDEIPLDQRIRLQCLVRTIELQQKGLLVRAA
jgi:hypothetical protein